MENSKKINFLDKIKSNKKLQTILIIVIFLIVFAVFLLNTFSKKESQTSQGNTQDLYVQELEERLSNTLSKVDGAGKVSIVITVESGMETVLAMKTETVENSSGKHVTETPVLVNGKTVVLKEMYPKIIGVLIVAEGANNIGVMRKIQQATVSLLDINVNQIEILTMK